MELPIHAAIFYLNPRSVDSQALHSPGAQDMLFLA
jgi:hypothetical protein